MKLSIEKKYLNDLCIAVENIIEHCDDFKYFNCNDLGITELSFDIHHLILKTRFWEVHYGFKKEKK